MLSRKIEYIVGHLCDTLAFTTFAFLFDLPFAIMASSSVSSTFCSLPSSSLLEMKY